METWPARPRRSSWSLLVARRPMKPRVRAAERLIGWPAILPFAFEAPLGRDRLIVIEDGPPSFRHVLAGVLARPVDDPHDRKALLRAAIRREHDHAVFDHVAEALLDVIV